MKTDYSKLNDRIVEQAYNASNMTLTAEMKAKLFQNKIDRAQAMIAAREKEAVYFQIED